MRPLVSGVPVRELVLELPEPPSLNRMIDLAKQRTRRTRDGGFMRRSLPVVYDQHKEAYELACLAAVRAAKVQLPSIPWKRWALDYAAFRVHGLRDPLELLAGLKWTCDFLVAHDIVANDSTRELRSIPLPTQCIARSNRGVTIAISEVVA